jgi:hypothetical protein
MIGRGIRKKRKRKTDMTERGQMEQNSMIDRRKTMTD